MKRSRQYHSVLMAASLLLAAGCVSYEDVKRQADAGDPAKQYQAAQMLLEGDGVPRNEAEAEKYLQKAMEADNLSAACRIAERILRRKKGDESERLMKAYDLIFSRDPRGGYAEFSAVYDRRRNYPGDVISYVQYLNKAGFWRSSMKFRKFAVQYLDRDRCNVPGRTIMNCKMKLATMKSPQEIAETKRLAEEKRKAEEARLEDPDFKFPMRKISDNRVPLSKGLVSGTSWAWCKKKAVAKFKKERQAKYAESRQKAAADARKFGGSVAQRLQAIEKKQADEEKKFLNNLTLRRKKYSADFDGFYIWNGDQCLFFATEKPFAETNQDPAVLVKREFQLSGNVTPEAAIRKILQDNPGAKHDKKKEVTRTTQDIQMLATADIEYTNCTETVRAGDKEWCFTYRTVKSHMKLTAYGKHKLSDFEKQNLNQQSPNGIIDGVTVRISDRKLVKAFSDIKVRETQRRKAAEKKALQEKTKKELDSLAF